MPDTPDGFAPHVLRDYALVADGHRAALFGPRGDVAWLCAPGWDDEAVLAPLIGGGGVFTVAPPDRYVWGGHYEEGSLIWSNRWIGCSSVLTSREALAMPSTPGTAVLLRRLVATEGDCEVDVRVEVCGDYGRAPSTVDHVGDGVYTGRSGGVHWRLSGARAARRPGGDEARVPGRHQSARSDGRGVGVRLTLPAGAHHDLVLEVSRHPFEGVEPVEPDRAWETTAEAWRRAVPDLPGVIARRDVRHAFAVLAGLTTPGGAMVAAATTSLPEHADGDRAYDYRYVWMRDQAYTCMALAAALPARAPAALAGRGSSPAAGGEVDPAGDGAGGAGEAIVAELFTRQLGWLVDRVLEHPASLAPAYRTDGSPVPGEVELELPGYPGGRTVVGNDAGAQHQLDTYGDLLMVCAAAAEHGHLSARGTQAARALAAAIGARWQEEDAGLWELEDAWWTQSRLACVAGLRAWARAGGGQDAGALLALAETIMAATASRCLDPGGWWRRSPAHEGTDTSLLLAAVRGALPPDDPRSLATVAHVRASLVEDGYVYRFAHDGRPLGANEGAFLLCGFVVALAEHQQGVAALAAGAHAAAGAHQVAAYRAFERTRAAAGAPGLLAEEFDVRQRQLRGNLPQAFVHAMLLETALTLGP